MSVHDPYAAPPRDRPATATVHAPKRAVPPAARLRRLGAPPALIDALEAVWEDLDADRAEWETDSLAVMADMALGAWARALEPPEGPVAEVVGWVESHDQPWLAAAVAVAYERGKPKPRSSLLAALAPSNGRQP